jgi:hypothetical protein
MLQVETESTLAKLFLTIIDCEREVEIARQSLLVHPSFDLRSMFGAIDRFNNGYLTSSDITGFLRSYGVPFTERELFELCYIFERSTDGKISYPRFSRRVIGREASRVQAGRSHIPRDLERQFVSYFQRELTSLRSIER